ncbi:MAG TPA: hypothetical protein VF544_04310 [Pyrinomonadaceae bacterium]
MARLGRTKVRVLGPEDHLRVLFEKPFGRTPPLQYQLGRFISLRRFFINQLLDSLKGGQ